MATSPIPVTLTTGPAPTPSAGLTPIPLYIEGPIPGFDIEMSTVGTLGPTDLQEILDEFFVLYSALSGRVTALENP